MPEMWRSGSTSALLPFILPVLTFPFPVPAFVLALAFALLRAFRALRGDPLLFVVSKIKTINHEALRYTANMAQPYAYEREPRTGELAF
ncbi:hypothetical protein NFHSH190041_34350 [Shewanella sp. NFH-SH190041]|uniref:hypothetical protein n=1 Tax=Shewanella sp. NFH-SH190041 TaxID=2950245 RepID=UPI0021C2DC8F|nr:hypothetical protein [Shewanella sp. NFH-SH190041]BDM65983.1 hypothetical protein NFHSH190041_34350 [Shewanella sp. NFH-SH190041]